MADVAFCGYTIGKEPSAPDSNDDAFCLPSGGTSFAVSDGVGRTLLSGGWARLLARAHLSFPRPDLEGDTTADHASILQAVDSWLDRPRRTWARWSRARLGDRLSDWNVSIKHREGARATFLAVYVDATARGYRWEAVALGDTCLFMTDNGTLTIALPLSDPAAFNNFPTTIPSHREQGEPWRVELRRSSGYAGKDSWIFGMTDAAAKWFLAAANAGEAPWSTLATLDSERAFREWVVRMRETNRLEYDDTTIVFGRLR